MLHRIPSGEKVSIERVTFPAVAAARGLFGLATDDYWIDTGQPEYYLQANLDVLSGMRRNDSAVAVDAAANVHNTAVIDHALVGAGTTVGKHAVVRRSVVLPGAAIDDGATVTESMVMGRVGAGAVVHGCVIGATGEVAPNEQVANARRPQPTAQ